MRHSQALLLSVALSFLAAESAFSSATYEVIRSFGFPDQLGHVPMAGLVRGPDGLLYGTTYYGGAVASTAGVVYRVSDSGSNYQVLHAFPSSGNTGRHPRAGLCVSSNGVLFGTTVSGGSNNMGLVFKLNLDGTGYSELHHFTGRPDGALPSGRVVIGTDGALYGTTSSGGEYSGSIYRLNQDGTDYRIVYRFMDGLDGARAGGLTPGPGGVLYGLTQWGGGTNRSTYGTIFRINEDGGGYQVLHRFDKTNGAHPSLSAELIRNPNGVLFGTTYSGGVSNLGTIFRIGEDGSGFAVLHEFSGGATDGGNPQANLTLIGDEIYGTTTVGGTNHDFGGKPMSAGVIFKINTAGSDYTVLRHLTDPGTQMDQYVSELLPGDDGWLYGTKAMGGNRRVGLVFRVRLDGSEFTNLRSFTEFGGDARAPASTMTRAPDGFFYGAAPGGGANNAGALFRLSETNLDYSVVYSFSTNQATSPSGRLVWAAPGVLYGTASSGGTSNKGAVFGVNTDGSGFSVLHAFTGADGDGDRPMGGLLLARDGLLYGTTKYGGTNGFGSIFRVNPSGSEYRVIHSFWPDGLVPLSHLVQGSDDALYGTTVSGGAYGRGTVFKVTVDGSSFRVLHDFSDDQSEGGGFPLAGLVIGPDGALYGTTAPGSSGAGILYRINQDGSDFTVIKLLTIADGWNPTAELMVGSDGVLYGTTQFGGSFGGQGGVVFQVNTNGSNFAVLHSFVYPVGPEGSRPTGGLIEGADGKLYGVTPLGGVGEDGVIFRIDPSVQTNHAPVFTASLPDHTVWILSSFDYVIPASAVFDADWNQTNTYSVAGLPPAITFNPATRVFSGIASNAGMFEITVTATDNGSPPASTSTQFRLTVLQPDLKVSHDGTNVMFNWPAPIYRFIIEESPELGPNATWAHVPRTWGNTIGDRTYFSIPVKPGTWFYRMSLY